MSLPPVYLAVINTPGYMPMAEDAPAFDTAREAWRYLASERAHEEEGAAVTGREPYSGTYDSLVILGDAMESQPGVAYGGTPGYDGDHDLGVAYSVRRIDHADYPHEAGYLIECAACESRCHCEPGNAPCVYQGEHS